MSSMTSSGRPYRRAFACLPVSSLPHYNDVTMSAIASQITSLTDSIVYLSANQRKHQSFALLAFVRGIHRRPVNSPHKGPVTRKMFPIDDVIMLKKIERVITGPCYTRDACCPRRARSLGRGRWCRRRNNRWRRASEGLPCTDRSGFRGRIRDHRRPESRTYWSHHTPGKKTNINSNGHMT